MILTRKTTTSSKAELTDGEGQLLKWLALLTGSGEYRGKGPSDGAAFSLWRSLGHLAKAEALGRQAPRVGGGRGLLVRVDALVARFTWLAVAATLRTRNPAGGTVLENAEKIKTTELRIVVTPYFNLAATMAFLDPFRAANYLQGMTLYRWQMVSEAGGMVTASNGVEVNVTPFAEADMGAADMLFVSSSWEPERHVSAAMRATLRNAAKRQAILGGLDTGAFILAHAGLMEDHTATVHYEHMDAFQELFPNTGISEALWVIDRRRVTCSGGAASLDLALHLVQQAHGSALANAAARYLFAPPLRDHGALQYPENAEPLGNTVPQSVRAAIRVMEANLETPLPIAEVCRKVGLSHRQLDRLFAQCVRKTPALYYRDIRLDRARGLVTQTDMTMSEIAYASGFSSQVHFSRAYKDRFGLPPSKDRVQGRIPFEFRAWPMHSVARPTANQVKSASSHDKL